MDNTICDGIEPTHRREQFATELKKMAKDRGITITLGQFFQLTEQAMRDQFNGTLLYGNGKITYQSTHDDQFRRPDQSYRPRRPRISRSATLITHR